MPPSYDSDPKTPLCRVFTIGTKELALGGDHRAPELVQHRPRGLMAADPELALQLLGRDPRMKRRDQVRGPEPRPQRQPRPVHHGARGHRRLPPAGSANPQVPARLGTAIPAAAPGAGEPLRPARREQVGATRLLGAKPLLELQDRQRKARARHPTKPRNDPDGANPVRTRPLAPAREHRRRPESGGGAGISFARTGGGTASRRAPRARRRWRMDCGQRGILLLPCGCRPASAAR